MPSDKKDNRIHFRANPELQTKINTIQNLLKFSTESEVVRHLVLTGLTFYQLRQEKIKEIQKEMENYNIQVWELRNETK